MFTGCNENDVTWKNNETLWFCSEANRQKNKVRLRWCDVFIEA